MSPHIKDPNFNKYLPVIPSEVSAVNFTWMSGKKKYHYHFDRLQSLDENILQPPTISIKSRGKVPQQAKGITYNRVVNHLKLNELNVNTMLKHFVSFFPFNCFPIFIGLEFSVRLPCNENSSGMAMFSIGLLIQTRRGKPLPGTPLRLNLRKECAHRGVYDRTTLTTPSQGSVCFLLSFFNLIQIIHRFIFYS